MSGDLLLSSSTLGEVLDHSADQAGDSTAIISAFQGISKNYSQFRNEVRKCFGIECRTHLLFFSVYFPSNTKYF